MGSLRRNAVWQLVQTLFGTGTEQLIVLVLAATLKSSDFGRYAIALSLSKLVFLLFEGRLHEFLTPKLSRYLGRHTRATWMWTRWSMRAELILNCAGLAVSCVVAVMVPTLSSQFDTELLLAATAYNGANTFLKFSSLAVLRCLGEVRQAAILAVVISILKLAGLAFGLQAGWSVPALLFLLSSMTLGASAFQAQMAVAHLRKRVGSAPHAQYRPLRRPNLQAQRALLASNYAVGLVELVHRELDMQLAAWLAGLEVAGHYRLAKTLAMTMMEALNPVVLVLLPDLSRRLAYETRESVAAFLRRISYILGGIGLGMAFAVVILTKAYFHWIAPQQDQSFLPMLILVVILTALSPWMWCQALLVAAGRPQAYLKSSAVGAALAIGGGFVFVPLAGVTGAVLAYGGGLMVTTMLAVIAGRVLLHDKPKRGT